MAKEYVVESSPNASGWSGWTGWVLFGSILMGVAGFFQTIAGLAAIFKEGVFLVGQDKLVFLSYQQWGWVHLIIGLILLLSAFSLASGHMWGRILGIILAMLSAIANFMFIPAYPIWCTLIIVMNILLIYSIAIHGGELKEE